MTNGARNVSTNAARANCRLLAGELKVGRGDDGRRLQALLEHLCLKVVHVAELLKADKTARSVSGARPGGVGRTGPPRCR